MTTKSKFAAARVYGSSKGRHCFNVVPARGISFSSPSGRAVMILPHRGSIGRLHAKGRLTAGGSQSAFDPGRASKSRPAYLAPSSVIPMRSYALPAVLSRQLGRRASLPHPRSSQPVLYPLRHFFGVDGVSFFLPYFILRARPLGVPSAAARIKSGPLREKPFPDAIAIKPFPVVTAGKHSSLRLGCEGYARRDSSLLSIHSPEHRWRLSGRSNRLVS